jgi:hypothetical protein
MPVSSRLPSLGVTVSHARQARIVGEVNKMPLDALQRPPEP